MLFVSESTRREEVILAKAGQHGAAQPAWLLRPPSLTFPTAACWDWTPQLRLQAGSQQIIFFFFFSAMENEMLVLFFDLQFEHF